MSSHVSKVHGTWQGGFKGQGVILSDGLTHTLALPTEFGGSGQGASPEALLLSAIAGCFLATLGIVFERGGVTYQDLQVAAELNTEMQPRPDIREVILKVQVTTDRTLASVHAMIQRAEEHCLVWRVVGGALTKKTVVEVLPFAIKMPDAHAGFGRG